MKPLYVWIKPLGLPVLLYTFSLCEHITYTKFETNTQIYVLYTYLLIIDILKSNKIYFFKSSAEKVVIVYCF